ncbi:MAG: phenylalanine--tRNA ligase subunit beta [Bacteroidales bacterium]|jgi:phenylalanyl-tRNA synthetase beta chain
MKISYNWLKQYISFDLSPSEVSKLLTDCGLEVESLTLFESVQGGLKGLVVGEVLTCEDHPNSDHLHLTTVDVGEETPLNVVCGAPNVAAGQKVIVATIGTTLYSGEKPFVIKKSKIRGEVSEGMICSEVEIGVGTSHEGILVLPEDTPVGLSAAELYKIEEDYIFEIGLTPNRGDAASHYGVARDLYAVMKHNDIPCSTLLLPEVSDLLPSANTTRIDIEIKNNEACPRYSGICIDDITVEASPKWLQDRLLSIGIKPINNVVDVTQYVMFEIGQPLHAFDSDKIAGEKIIVQNLPTGTPFITLDGHEIKLDEEDLMICHQSGPMCIAGVYGGIESGITENSKNIFIESAYFHPTSVRKTSKRHHLKTDAAFRYERGCDVDMTLYALKRAANLLQNIAGATHFSEIIDLYPYEVEKDKILLSLVQVEELIGKKIEDNEVINILQSLGFNITVQNTEHLLVEVPHNKSDVTRPVDLIEEILRIYGYNQIELPEEFSFVMQKTPQKGLTHFQREISLHLIANGFYEMMNNSLTKSSYIEQMQLTDLSTVVRILNPLSNELDSMRQTLLTGALETVERNINNGNPNLRLFEFGKTYFLNPDAGSDAEVTEKYHEKEKMALLLTGKKFEKTWNQKDEDVDLFYLKNIIEHLFVKANAPIDKITSNLIQNSLFVEGLEYLIDDQAVLQMGEVHPRILKLFDIKKIVYYAEVNLNVLLQNFGTPDVVYQPISPYPSVKRDLSLILDRSVDYGKLEEIAFKYGGSKLKKVTLFDVYEGANLGDDKKSYALNFVLQNESKTLTEEEINKIMNKLISAFEKECGAQLR